VFPVALQAVGLVGVLGLALNGLGIGADMKANELMTLRKTNLTTLVIWGLWWPAMIAAALAFGRAWCTVCPMEMVNRAADALARKIGWPRARLGKFLRAGWLIVVLYLVLQILVAGISVHRVPHYTSLFLLALVGGALITGLVFRESRSFCRAFCPAGALLSVYGRYTPLQLEIRDPSVCEACRTKDCVRAENRDRFDKRSCPSLLTPFRREPSDGCVLCLQCAKVCPHANLGVGLVMSEAPVRRKSLLRPFEAAFVMVALGFVAHEVIGEVKWLDGFFHAVPKWLSGFQPSVPFGWLEALWFLVLFPLAVWAGIAGLGFLMGHRGGLRALLLAAATGAAPVVAVAHLAKAAAKVAAWGGYLPLAVRDPQGIETFHRIAAHTLTAPGGILGLSMVGWAMLGLTLIMAWKAWTWARHVPAESTIAAKSGLAGAALLFGTVLTIWVWPVA
jgi:polyferredoxin